MPKRYGLPQKPEKSGIDAVPWLGCCANADEENRAAAAVEAAMMNVRMINVSR
jgi:hypothetical protein